MMLARSQYMKIRLCSLWFLCTVSFMLYSATSFDHPRVTVVLVIDAGAKALLSRVTPFFEDGLKVLLDKGLSYEEAYHPHGIPETAPGHATLATGTYPINHGWIRNDWYEDGVLVKPDQDNRSESLTINPLDGSFYSKGASARYLMVDSLGDQCAIAEVGHKVAVCALSAKARAAIPFAGRGGKAFWFDNKTGCYTSSKAYFDKLPQWLVTFNTEINQDKDRTKFTWTLAHPRDDSAYAFEGVRQQDYSEEQSYIGEHRIDRTSKEPFELFEKTPLADRLLGRCAQTCFEDWVEQAAPDDQLLLCVSFSALDKVSHRFGPWSREDLDILYHLDATIGDLMRALEARIPRKQILWALAADHGNMPIVSQLKARGMDFATKINEQELAREINQALEQEFGYADAVQVIDMPFVYTNPQRMKELSVKDQRKVIQGICKYLKRQPYCLDAWSSKKLRYLPTDEKDMRWRLKKHLYQGRCGDVTFLFRPYTILTHHVGGTSHITPYDYDLHVPLILYGGGMHTQGVKVYKPVDTTQLAPTLATLMGVPRPSASNARLLPLAIPL